jgi:cyclic pyranopterin phosphate synthase
MAIDSKIFNPQAKILVHLDKVLDFFKNKNVDPITLEIDPSNACNHSCPFCISGHIHLKKFKDSEFFDRSIMSPKLLMKLSSDVCDMDIKSISWTGGGEPTLNPKLGDAIKYIKTNSKIKLGLYTNGTLLSKFNLFNTLVSSLEWIRISIDAGKKQSYDKLRVTNSNNNFDVVLENIEKLIYYKKKKNSKIIIGVGFVVTKENYKEISDFSNLFKNFDIDYCQFKPEIIQVERNQILSNTKQQIASNFWLTEVIDQLNKAKEILGKKFECNSYKLEDLLYDSSNYGRVYGECIGSQFQPCIGADGNVYVCTNHRGHKEYSYGNIKDKSLKEIWGDLKKRKCVMDKINFDEKFSNCTQLCKPHESNKILWTIKQNLNDPNYINSIKKKSTQFKKFLNHQEFI